MSISEFLGEVGAVAQQAGAAVGAVRTAVTKPASTKPTQAASALPSWVKPVGIVAGLALAVGLLVALFRRKPAAA